MPDSCLPTPDSSTPRLPRSRRYTAGMLYTTLKFVHVLLAIVAVGFNASYGIWLARAARQPEHLGYVLRGIKILDDRAANPAYGLLLLTGLAMVAVAGYPPSTFWIAAALVLWLIAIVIGFAGYTPALRRQIETLERVGPTAAEYEQRASRARVIGMINIVPIVLI